MLATALFLSASGAMADEALFGPSLDTPIARAPDLTLRSLLPVRLDEAVADGFSKRVSDSPYVMSNDPDGPFEVVYEVNYPEGSFIIYSLYVSENPRLIGLLDQFETLAKMPGAPFGELDEEFPAQTPCKGVAQQMMINCWIGSGGVQFTASDVMESGALDYTTFKEVFLSVEIENYRTLFGE
jgi:hypothetical protein